MGLQHIGRQSQHFVKKDGTYAAIPTFAATDYVRQRAGLTMSGNLYNREHSVEKKVGAGHFSRRDRKTTAGFSGLTAEIRPSATINTLPEIAALLENTFGALTNVTLSTTVASGGTTTGCTLTSPGTLAKYDAVLITCPDGKKRIRRLQSVAGSVVTWAPALTAPPANGAAVKGGLAYKLTTANALSFGMARYTRKTDQSTGFREALLGCGITRASFMCDDKDPVVTFDGVAAQLMDPTSGSFPAQPGSATQVGGNPPTGMDGELWLGATVAKMLKLGVELTTNAKLRNEEADQRIATEIYRGDYYDIAASLDTRASKDDEALLYDVAWSATPEISVFRQQGFTEGNIFALYMPRVEVIAPDTDAGINELNWPFKLTGLESVEDDNDGLTLMLC